MEIDYDKYADTASAWGTTAKTVNEPYDYTTASGKLVLIQRLGMTDILKLGLLDTLDFFTKSLSEDEKKQKVATGQAGEQFTKALLGNFDKMEDTINAVVQVGVLAPKLYPVPMLVTTEGDVTKKVPNDSARQAGLLYVDSVPFETRVELFGEIMDTEGLSDFREESSPGVGDVPADEVVQSSPVSDVGFAG